MPKKNTLLSYKLIDTGDMSQATITSAVTSIQFLDDIAIQMVWTGSPVGTFAIQGSVNHQQDNQGNVTTPGTWTAITLNPAPAATGVAGDWLLDMATLSFPFIRLVYTKTSGTGTLDAFISGKEI